MGIILRIRKFLRLDPTTIEVDNNVINATALIIPELKYFMKEPDYGCLSSSCNLLPADTVTGLHLPAGFNHPQGLHV
ncbi:MAG TPA: hypothetical protein VIZ28_16995 [Chitinophagaceae bacterium]